MRLGVAVLEGHEFVAAQTPDGIFDLGLPRGAGVEAWIGRHGTKPPTPSELGSRLRNAESIRWRAPLVAPPKIVCIGLNYLDHCREQGIDPPKEPVVFAKFASAIVGPDDVVRWSTSVTQKVDYEAELAFVVGRKARNVAAKDAHGHVAGFLCANDVTARDLQKGDGQWIRGKSLDTFAPLGPYLVTPDEIDDPQKLGIRCRVNGETRQDSSTKNLIFGMPELVAFLSRAFTLLPGDVVLTGTPPGVGVFRKPPLYLQDGDRIEVDIDGLGVLPNLCRVEPAKS